MTKHARFRRQAALVLSMLLASSALQAGKPKAKSPDTLRTGFQNPPASARPRVWWHWMNGNITEDGIRKDLEWMKRIGIGGLQNFDANLATPQVVDKRLVYMTPEWKHAFRYAATLAEQKGLELAIASSPGWSETGGPWVQAKDGLKKLVWSENRLTGGRPFTGMLASPPSATGLYQSLGPAPDVMGAPQTTPPPQFFKDIGVFAYRDDAQELPTPRVLSASGEVINGAALFDESLTTALSVEPGTSENPGSVVFDYGAPQTVRSATMYQPGAVSIFAVTKPILLEASTDGTTWRPVASIPRRQVPTTIGFAPVTARWFRVVLAPSTGAKFGQFVLSAAARLNEFQAKAAFAIVPDYYALSESTGSDEAGVAPTAMLNLADRMKPDGTLDWTPPAGHWRVVRIGYSLTGKTNHPAPAEATGLEVDKFDGAAVRRYLETYLGMYRDAAGADLIGARGVRAFLTDSTEIGAANWTPRMVEQFRRLRGYDPTPWLPALTGVLIGTRAQSDAFLYDYRRTLADLMASEHYGTVATVAHEHGLKVYGEALEDHRPVIGDDMAMRSHTDVPMAAMWVYDRKAGPRLSYIADIKGAAAVSHIYGQNLVAAESMTSLSQPWSDVPADLRRVVDLEFALGVNRPVIHTSVHQPLDKGPGVSLFFIGQFFNRNESWAELARPWVDYMARNSFLLQQGRNVADVAYFYGEEAPLTGLYGDVPVSDAPHRYAYDFVNADVLANRLTVRGSAIVSASGARYALLYLGGSSRRMTLPTLRRLAAMVEAGATVVGTAPVDSPSLADDKVEFRKLTDKLWSGAGVTRIGKGRVIAGQDVEAALATISIRPDFAYVAPLPDTQLLFAHRKLSDGDAYFIDNRQNRTGQVEARFRVKGKVPELWRADTGTVEPLSYRIEGGETVVPLTFDPEESFFVVFRKPAIRPAMTIAPKVFAPVLALDGAWDVTFQPGRGAPAGATLPALRSLSENADPGVKYFSGIATYSRIFTLPQSTRPGRSLMLDLGTVADLAEVRVNGVNVGTAWHAPYRIDIGRAIRTGTNTLEIRVANRWINRLIGDQQPGATKIASFTIPPPYRANTALRPAGLMGPVTLSAPKTKP